MSPETKKTLLIAGAGLAGIAVIWYLLKGGGLAGQAVSSAGVQPLSVPTPGDITFNYPPLVDTGVTPAPAPSCTQLCEECDDMTSYGSTAIWKVAPGALASQYENLQSVGQQTVSRASYVTEYVSGLAGVTEQVYESGG